MRSHPARRKLGSAAPTAQHSRPRRVSVVGLPVPPSAAHVVGAAAGVPIVKCARIWRAVGSAPRPPAVGEMLAHLARSDSRTAAPIAQYLRSRWTATLGLRVRHRQSTWKGAYHRIDVEHESEAGGVGRRQPQVKEASAVVRIGIRNRLNVCPSPGAVVTTVFSDLIDAALLEPKRPITSNRTTCDDEPASPRVPRRLRAGLRCALAFPHSR